MTQQIACDYLAFTMIGTGGSWARDPDPEKAIARCAKIAKADWNKYYKLDGATILVGLYDATGHDRLSMGERGVYAGNKEIPPKEIRAVLLPGRKKK